MASAAFQSLRLSPRARIASICLAEARLIHCFFTMSRPPERDQPRHIAALCRNHGVELRADQSHCDGALLVFKVLDASIPLVLRSA
jgi:hypothetical protein